MAIWISWNIDIQRSLNSHDSFPRRKFENWAPTSCRLGPIPSMSTITFELHAKVAEIDPEMCSYGQLSEVQMDSDLYLTLDRVKIASTYRLCNIHTTCRTTSVAKHVTVASRTTTGMVGIDAELTGSAASARVHHSVCQRKIGQWSLSVSILLSQRLLLPVPASLSLSVSRSLGVVAACSCSISDSRQTQLLDCHPPRWQTCLLRYSGAAVYRCSRVSFDTVY